MATITTLSNPTYATADYVAPRHMDNTKLPYVIWREIDLAAAATAKGSALAASDIIEAVRVPSNHMVLGGFVAKTTALVGTVSVLTVSVGITGVGATDYANAWDAFAATVGTNVGPTAAPVPRVINATDTVDILLASLTGTLTGGKIRVGVLVQDISVDARGLVAQPKS